MDLYELSSHLGYIYDNLEHEYQDTELGLIFRKYSFISKYDIRTSASTTAHRPSTDMHQALGDIVAAVDKDSCLSNHSFHYYTISASLDSETSGVILFFHGLNEKSWHKYLPWAYRLSQHTGRVIVLFPLAYHMDRAPKEWIDPRYIQPLVKYRQSLPDNKAHTSFVNAALSYRLSIAPDRFFWSGYHSAQDVLEWIRMLKLGQIQYLDPDSTIDIFGYSIGAYMSTILMMANPSGYFSRSKMVGYGGGVPLDMMHPESKYILDSDATRVIMHRLHHHIGSRFADAPAIAKLLYTDTDPMALTFQSMLSKHHLVDIRLEYLTQIADRLCYITTSQDKVCPAEAFLDTFDHQQINMLIHRFNFEYEYTHEFPFPIKPEIERVVSESFERVFEVISKFYVI